ncbi:MAG: hypothetical protein ABI193_08650 [Minicystis sp.]
MNKPSRLLPTVLVALVAAAGCSSVDPSAFDLVKGPAFGSKGADFQPVSAVFERRCGTLDCHGSAFRPMRIYGQNGLRRPEPKGSKNVNDFTQYFSGGLEPTTSAELADNYQSVIALEPELVAQVVQHLSEPDVLTVVRKARLQEKHKGGLLWNQGDYGDACLTNWFTGASDTSPCDKEVLLHK